MKTTWIYFFRDGISGATSGLAAALTELRLGGEDTQAVEVGPLDDDLISVLGLWVRAPDHDILDAFREKLEARFAKRKIEAKGAPWSASKVTPPKDSVREPED